MATLEERVAALERIIEAGYTSIFGGPTIDAILSRAKEGGIIDVKISSMRQDAVDDIDAATESAKQEVKAVAQEQADAASASASRAEQSAANAASSAQSAADAAQNAAESVLDDYGELKEQVQTDATRIDKHTETLHALGIQMELGQGNLQSQIQDVRADLSDAERTLADTGDAVRVLRDTLTESGATDLSAQSGDALATETGEALQGPATLIKTDRSLALDGVPADALATGKSMEGLQSQIQDVRVEALESAITAISYAGGLMYDYPERLGQWFIEGIVVTLPVLNLWGDISKMSKSVKVPLTYSWQGKTGDCTCKWQGASSIRFPEKNYTISFDRDFKLNDKWPAYHKWCFKSNWVDCTQSRGISCARIWASLVAKWADAYTDENLTDESGDALTMESGSAIQYPAYTHPIKYAPNYGATDGFPCVVEINGEFVGIYTCQIPKDEYMFGMNGTAGEAVVNASSYNFNERLTDENFSTHFDVECATDDMTVSVIIEKLNVIYDILHGKSNDMMDALSEHMNLTCTIDYMLFSALTCNFDGIIRNWNLYTFDGGEHWNFSAYDLDNTCGNEMSHNLIFAMPGSWNVKRFDKSNSPLKYVTNNYLFNRIYALNKSAIVERYNIISQNVLTPNQVYYNHVDFVKDIPLWLYLMDFKRWPTKPGTSIKTLDTIGAHVIMQAAALEQEIAALQ